MSRAGLRRLQVGLAFAILVFLVASYGLSRASRPDTEASAESLDRVVLFAVPELGLEDVDSGLMPNLDRLARRGAIGVANVRTLPDAPDVVAAYASLSAGNRTGGAPTSPDAVLADAPWLGTTAADLIELREGAPVDGELAVPFLPQIAEEVAPEGGSSVGALGTALRDDGRRTAFVGQSGGWGTDGPARQAPGALVAVDEVGMADAGSVADDLLTTLVDDEGRSRLVSDPESFAEAVGDTQDNADLVVVDTGDTARARNQADAEAEAAAAEEPDDAATTTTTIADQGSTTTTIPEPTAEERAEDLRASALRRTDLTLGRVADRLEPGTLLLVVGVTPPGDSYGFTPIVATGPGIERGYLDSASTHRPALVTLTDLAPTILDTLDVEVPDGMIGQALRYRSASSTWDEARILDDLIADRAAIDRTTGIVFIGAQAVLYGLAVLLLATGRGLPSRFRRLFVLGSLMCAAWPVATYLLRIRTSLYSMGITTLVLSWVIALGIATVALRFRRHPLDPLLAVAALTVTVLVADLAMGANLQVGSFFGYMPHTAPRFTGLGNSGFAILAASAIVTVTLIVARARDRRAAWWVAAAVAVVVVIADGAPWMGTDVGGILALVPALGLALWAARGRPIKARTVLIGLALGAVVLGLAVGFEALRPPADRTHIGRFFLEADDGSTVGDTLRRKWSTNVADLGRNKLLWIVPVLVVAGIVVGRRNQSLARLLPPSSPQRIIVGTTLFAGVLGWLVNDSGVVVLALACVHLGALFILSATTDRPIAPMGPFDEPEDRPTPEAVEDGDEADDDTIFDDGREVVVALVPAKDRGDSVADTVRALAAIERVDRVLVVDDGSTDDTTERAVEAGATVLRLGRNRGKGGAVLAGVAHCPDATVFLLIDADLARTAAAADALLDPVLAGEAELTIGVLPSAGSKAGFGTIKRLSREGIRRACGLTTEAPLSGQRAIRAPLLRDLHDAERFGLEVAMTIDTVRAGATVVEVPVPMDHRHTGRSIGGFAHRGRQGLDIVRSLWPRLGGRLGNWVLLAAVLFGWVGASYGLAGMRAPSTSPVEERASKVLVVGVPSLALSDVDEASMPALAALAERGTLALATPRTGSSRVPANAYATLGAGDLASAPGVDPEVLDLDSRDGSLAASALETEVEGEVFIPALVGWPNTSVNGASHVGALGDALHEAGFDTGVVANSSGSSTADDPGDGGSITPRWSAPAALLVTDAGGQVDSGTVSNSLLTTSERWPGGWEADPDRFVEEVVDALTTADVVVVDTGETDRWRSVSSTVPADVSAQSRAAALATTDAVIAGLDDAVGDDVLIVVVGVSPNPGRPLVPMVLDGPGWSDARAASRTTRQADLVGFVDVAPTVLEALGAEVPDAMSGTAILRADGAPDRGSMERTEQLVIDRDDGYQTMVDQMVWGSAAVFTLLAAAFIVRFRTGRNVPAPLRTFGRWATLTLAAVPLATYVVRWIEPVYGRGWTTIAVMWLVAGVVALLALRVDRHPLDPLLVVCAALWVLVTIDLFLGGSLQVSSYLGHTPSVAARFVGLGNAGFGAYGAAAVVLCAGLVARSGRRSGTWVLAVGIAALTVLSVGLPWLGSDVGGILSLVPVLGLVLWTLRGRRLTMLSAGLAALAASAALAVAVVIEAFRPAEDRTHIGRFFLGSDSSTVFDTFSRKWSVNVELLQGSTWAWLIWFGIAFAVVVLLTHDRGRGLAAPRSPEWIGATGLVVLAVLGWVTNDSGPLVAALVAGVLAAYLTLLALDDRPAEELLEPEEAP